MWQKHGYPGYPTRPKRAAANTLESDTVGHPQRSPVHVLTGQSCFGSMTTILCRWFWCYGWSVYFIEVVGGSFHAVFHLSYTRRSIEKRLQGDWSALPFLQSCLGLPLIGFVATQNPPSEKGMISVLEGTFFQGLGVKTLYPALNQKSGGQAERPHLQSRSWTKCVRASWTVLVGFARCWGSSELVHTAPGCKSSPGSSSSHRWTSLAPYLGQAYDESYSIVHGVQTWILHARYSPWDQLMRNIPGPVPSSKSLAQENSEEISLDISLSASSKLAPSSHVTKGINSEAEGGESSSFDWPKTETVELWCTPL